MTIGNAKKNTDNKGTHRLVWVSELDQGAGQADVSLELRPLVRLLNLFKDFFPPGRTSGEAQEALIDHLWCLINVIMLNFLSCE